MCPSQDAGLRGETAATATQHFLLACDTQPQFGGERSSSLSLRDQRGRLASDKVLLSALQMPKRRSPLLQIVAVVSWTSFSSSSSCLVIVTMMMTGHEEQSSHSLPAETESGLSLTWKLEPSSSTLVAINCHHLIDLCPLIKESMTKLFTPLYKVSINLMILSQPTRLFCQATRIEKKGRSK